jgi:hypothetical protein
MIWLDEVVQREILTIQIKEIRGDRRWQIAFDSWEAYRVDSESNLSYQPSPYEEVPGIGLTVKIDRWEWIESLSRHDPMFPKQDAVHYEVTASDWVFGVVTTSKPVVVAL